MPGKWDREPNGYCAERAWSEDALPGKSWSGKSVSHESGSVRQTFRGIRLGLAVVMSLSAIGIGCGPSAETRPPMSNSATAGTEPASSPEPRDKEEPRSNSERKNNTQAEHTAQTEKLNQPVPGTGETMSETWDAVYMGEAKVGSIRTVFERITLDGQPMVRASSWQELEILRFGQAAKMKMHVEAIETPQGAVKSFKTETLAGPTPILVEGSCQDGKLALVTHSQGKQVTNTVDWKESNGGFFAVEHSLSRQPMQPGEHRRLTMLMPGLTGIQVVTAAMHAGGQEPVHLLDRTESLLRINQKIDLSGIVIEAVCWVNAQGDILKTSIPALNQTTIRTTQQLAQKSGTAGEFDLGWDTIVKVTPPLPHPHQLTRAVYEVSLPEKNPAQVFASGPSQIVQPQGAHAARITVLAVRPDDPLGAGNASPPGASDLESNSLIQADDPRIVELATQVAGPESTAWKKAVVLEKWVDQSIRAKNFGQGFATAADVARSLEGDCTEHAVLLAALCRAQGIPARVVVGLVYSSSDQGFAFHMWNEAWVHDRWIGLDATLGQAGIGAAHIKLAHSNLSRESAETAVLSVVQVINQLKIKVLEFEPR